MAASAHFVLVHLRRLAEIAHAIFSSGGSPDLESMDMLLRRCETLVIEVERQLTERQREVSELRLLLEQARVLQIAMQQFIRSLPPPGRPVA